MQLSAYERACLAHVAAHPDGEDGGCSRALLDHLVAHGLLTREASLSLPGMGIDYRYRLTAAGLQALTPSR